MRNIITKILNLFNFFSGPLGHKWPLGMDQINLSTIKYTARNKNRTKHVLTPISLQIYQFPFKI